MHLTQDDFVAFLDDISSWFVHRDFDRWRMRILLPFTSITPDGAVVMQDEKDLLVDFNHHLAAADIMGLDMLDRRPLTLEQCDDGSWLGSYETRVISNGQLALDPFVSTALLMWDDGIVKTPSVMGGRGHTKWTRVKPT